MNEHFKNMHLLEVYVRGCILKIRNAEDKILDVFMRAFVWYGKTFECAEWELIEWN